MSEGKLNLIDAEQVLYGTIHGSIADACVAALSAEPETISELESALARYRKTHNSSSHFGSFSATKVDANNHRAALDTEPWDAGIVIIDLAARIVATESYYSQPGPEGEVFYHDGETLTDVPILYRVPDDWLFVNSVDAHQWSRERRVRERAAKPAHDARSILFGRPLLEFIVNSYRSFPSVMENELRAREVSAIHARWLLTPREDLCGQSPRDVLLARQDFIDFDLHTRSLQWSLQNEGPPCLDKSSCAYRYAGFGTHEWVLYYDLVRYLISGLVDLSSDLAITTAGLEVDQLIAFLDRIKTRWLESPQPECAGRIPAIVIDNERKRLPEAMRPRDMIVDEDCPMCQAFGDETSPLGMGVGSWHLDGCNMDDDFAFSHYETRAEWEAENRRREEFSKEFDRQRAEREQRIARGELVESDLLESDSLEGLEAEPF